MRAYATLTLSPLQLHHKPGDSNVLFYRAANDPAAVQQAGNDPSLFYDLHGDLAVAGANDVDSIPYLLPRWTPVLPSQVPYTFPYKLPAAAPAAPPASSPQPPQTAARPRIYKNVRYCHSFAHEGICRATDEVTARAYLAPNPSVVPVSAPHFGSH